MKGWQLLFLVGLGFPVLLLGCRGGSSVPAAKPGPRVITATPTTTPLAATATSLPTATFEPSATSTPFPSPLPPRPASTITPTPTAEPPALSQYSFAISLNYGQQQLVVSQTVTYVNSETTSLEELLLVVEPNRSPNIFQLDGLRWEDGRPVGRAELDGALLRLPLERPLAPGDSVTLQLAYTLELPPGPEPLGYTARQMTLSDWYPRVPPRSAGGWIMAEPHGQGEHTTYALAAFFVEIELIDGSPELEIAAPGRRELLAGGARFTLEAGRNFTWAVSPEWVTLEQETETGITVRGYFYPEHATAGLVAVETAAAALPFFAEQFAPYPHDVLVIAEAELADGAEAEGLFFLNPKLFDEYGWRPEGFLEPVTVHEVSHSWFYGLVGSDQAREPWLDEALATYSELLFYEALQPERVDWWWAFRVERFNSPLPLDTPIYAHADFRSYVDTVYLNGVRFLDELRMLLGEAAFERFLKQYVAAGSGGLMSTAQFFTLAEEIAETDLQPLREKYFSDE